MGSMQRADRFELLFKALKKHYKPVSPVSDRKVLDHLLYACCLQDATQEAADEAFAKIQQAYFDSNEIRVTTIAELSESLTSLKHAAAAASRIKKSLQAMFEARYSFDIDDLKKSNLGKAVDEITGWIGVTKFVVSYVTQHAFGGHSIPVDDSTLTVCHLLDLITPAEVEKGVLPGIERAIPKTKGLEFASLLHQFAVDHATSHKNPLVVAVFKELGMTSKPKAPPPPPPPPPPVKVAKPIAATKQPAAKTPPKVTKTKPVMSIAASAAAQTAKTAAAAELAAAKAKKAEAASPSKSGDSKTTKSAEAAKPSKPTKMSSPPAATKPPTKGATNTPKPAEPASKKSSSATSNARATIKAIEKAPAKSEAKPAQKKVDTKKADAKKVDTKKPVTKKGTAAPPPKPTTKSGTSSAKPAPKKLPVKPVTQKRTKPR